MLEEYAQAPEVARTRLYLETMEEVFGETGKVMISGEGDGSNLIYLPLDGMIGDPTRGLQFEEQHGIQVPRGISGGAADMSPADSIRGDRQRTTRGSN